MKTEAAKANIYEKKATSAEKGNFSDGIWRQNIVVMSGLLAGPVIAGATNIQKSVSIVIVFTLITALTVILCRLIPRKIVYTLRIILYVAVASLAYIPIILLTERLMGEAVVAEVGIYLPILIANPVIVSRSETRFYLIGKGAMIKELLGYIIGFDLVCLFSGFLRDLLAKGGISRLNLQIPLSIPALETTFGGFIFVGLLAGISRWLYKRGR